MVRRVVIFTLLAAAVQLATAGCKKQFSGAPDNQLPSTWSQVFDRFWNEMNVNYVYWDTDTTRWDEMYGKYKPLFGQLRWNDTADLRRSVHYFREMTAGLMDRHYTISFLPAVLADSSIDPALDQLRNSPSFRPLYSYVTRDASYLDPGYFLGNYNGVSPGLLALSGTIYGQILFFTCNQFALSEAFQSASPNSVPGVMNYFFGRLRHPSGIKGVLLDFRGNPGGSVSDLNFFAGQFIGHPLHFGATRYKSGNGRLDYTPWIDAYVQPQGEDSIAPLPVVILADRYSASMAEIVTMALRAMPRCHIVGETTLGATGPFTTNSLYNDGPFTVPGFLSVVTSSAEFRYVDGNRYEGKGFPPDYPVPFDPRALAAGNDPQMEKALSLFN